MSLLHRNWVSVCFFVLLALAGPSYAQKAKPIGNLNLIGKVKTHTPGLLTIIDTKGKETEVKYQEDERSAVSLGGGEEIQRIPCRFKVVGRVPFTFVEEGMVLQFSINVGRGAKTQGEVKYAKLMPAESNLQLKFTGNEPDGSDTAAATVVGKVRAFRDQRYTFDVPKSKYVPLSKLSLQVSEEAIVDLSSDKMSNVQAGDEITRIDAVEMSTGDIVAKNIEVRLDGRRFAKSSYDAQLWRKYSEFSDKPTLPREVWSKYFVLHTDISPRSEKVLFEKLDQMYEIIASYYRKRPREKIHCYVISSPQLWIGNPAIPEYGMYKILRREGVTISGTMTVGRVKQTKSIVFACDDHGIVQHEAVHAICNQTFGSAGPTWYAEGMAEVANYWKRDKLAIDIDPVVMDYLANNETHSLEHLLRPNQKTGDSWQAYAWRWALCQMLVQNPNYNRDFKKLGVELMLQGREPGQISFDTYFANVRDRIEFEFNLFSKNLGNGYRIDLCAWDWDQKPRNIPDGSRAKLTVDAQKGWQTTPILLEAGVSYDMAAQNVWKIGNDQQPIDANGNQDGDGRLVCAIFKDFQLSEEIELGTLTTITPKQSGQLVFRCREKWTRLEDNSGELTVYIRRTPQQ